MTLEQKLTDLIAALDALTAAMNNGQKPARPAAWSLRGERSLNLNGRFCQNIQVA